MGAAWGVSSMRGAFQVPEAASILAEVASTCEHGPPPRARTGSRRLGRGARCARRRGRPGAAPGPVAGARRRALGGRAGLGPRGPLDGRRAGAAARGGLRAACGGADGELLPAGAERTVARRVAAGLRRAPRGVRAVDGAAGRIVGELDAGAAVARPPGGAARRVRRRRDRAGARRPRRRRPPRAGRLRGGGGAVARLGPAGAAGGRAPRARRDARAWLEAVVPWLRPEPSEPPPHTPRG